MSVVTDLEKLLTEERALLLAGDYAGLDGLIERKSKLEQRLAEKKPDLSVEAYEQLAQKAKHNEALLEAAQRGLHSAMSQLRQLADGESQKTYSKDGQRTSLSRKPVSIAQKI